MQFTISIALIAITLVMALQNRFARDMDLGFDRDNLLIVRVPDAPDREALARSFRDRVARHPEVVEASLSSSVPSDRSEDNISIFRPDAVRPVTLGYHRVDSRFFEELRRGAAGRPHRDDARGRGRGRGGRVGSRRDQQFGAAARSAMRAPMRRSATCCAPAAAPTRSSASCPTCISARSTKRCATSCTSSTTRPAQSSRSAIAAATSTALLAFVDRSWSALVPDKPIVREFLDDRLDALYGRERSQAALLSLFSAVAIALSCLGLFGMVAFAVQRRTREIALRKVMGARSADIARLLLWQFSRPVLFANLIAWPAAWLILSRWLNGFAYRIDMPLWAYAVAGATALLIAWLAVGAHTLRVARQNPIKALREL